MEEVGRKGDILFINDSKATNADSTEKALLSFDRVFWILGGKAKEGGITSLAPHFPKIERAYLIGEAADAFAATLAGKVPFRHCGTLDDAVAQATAMPECPGCPRRSFYFPRPAPRSISSRTSRRAATTSAISCAR